MHRKTYLTMNSGVPLSCSYNCSRSHAQLRLICLLLMNKTACLTSLYKISLTVKDGKLRLSLVLTLTINALRCVLYLCTYINYNYVYIHGKPDILQFSLLNSTYFCVFLFFIVFLIQISYSETYCIYLFDSSFVRS